MHGVTRASDGIILLVTSVTHCDNCHKSWHTHDKCVTDLLPQKVHRGNFQGFRRIFNEIKNYLIIFFSNCSKWLSTLVSLSRQSPSLWKYSWPYLLQSWCMMSRKHPPGPAQCSGDQCSSVPSPYLSGRRMWWDDDHKWDTRLGTCWYSHWI